MRSVSGRTSRPRTSIGRSVRDRWLVGYNDTRTRRIGTWEIHLVTDPILERLIGTNDACADEVANGKRHRTPVDSVTDSTDLQFRILSIRTPVPVDDLWDAVLIEDISNDVGNIPNRLQECLLHLFLACTSNTSSGQHKLRKHTCRDHVVVVICSS